MRRKLLGFIVCLSMTTVIFTACGNNTAKKVKNIKVGDSGTDYSKSSSSNNQSDTQSTQNTPETQNTDNSDVQDGSENSDDSSPSSEDGTPDNKSDSNKSASVASICGLWSNKDVTVSYEFNDDGTLTINKYGKKDYSTSVGVYETDNSTYVTLKYNETASNKLDKKIAKEAKKVTKAVPAKKWRQSNVDISTDGKVIVTYVYNKDSAKKRVIKMSTQCYEKIYNMIIDTSEASDGEDNEVIEPNKYDNNITYKCKLSSYVDEYGQKYQTLSLVKGSKKISLMRLSE